MDDQTTRRPGVGDTRAKAECISNDDRGNVSRGSGEVNPPPIPTILCERTPRGNFRFWCQHCREYHLHGGAGGEGHRGSHCWSKAGRRAYPNGYNVAFDRRQTRDRGDSRTAT